MEDSSFLLVSYIFTDFGISNEKCHCIVLFRLVHFGSPVNYSLFFVCLYCRYVEDFTILVEKIHNMGYAKCLIKYENHQVGGKTIKLKTKNI